MIVASYYIAVVVYIIIVAICKNSHRNRIVVFVGFVFYSVNLLNSNIIESIATTIFFAESYPIVHTLPQTVAEQVTSLIPLQR